MVSIGDKVRFIPGGLTDPAHEGAYEPVTGTVIAVNREHRHYTVEAYMGTGARRRKFRETFKFKPADD